MKSNINENKVSSIKSHCDVYRDGVTLCTYVLGRQSKAFSFG